MSRKVIGLVGTLSSGKGTFADYLTSKGFVYYSLSDSLRDIATKLKLPHERDTLADIGNTLRERFGNDILARGAKRMVEDSDKDFVIDSIRNPAEVELLKQELNAYIVGIITSPERAFQFMEERNRPGDPQTWEEFIEVYERDLGITSPKHGLQIGSCLQLADVVVQNDGTRPDLESKIKELLFSRYGIEGNRSYKEKL